ALALRTPSIPAGRAGSFPAGRHSLVGSVAECLERLDRVVERRHPDQPDPLHGGLDRHGAVGLGGEEDRGTVPPSGGDLLLDAADAANLTGAADGAGPGDVLAAGERAGRELVVDRESEHQARARTTDVLVDVDLDLEWEVV